MIFRLGLVRALSEIIVFLTHFIDYGPVNLAGDGDMLNLESEKNGHSSMYLGPKARLVKTVFF